MVFSCVGRQAGRQAGRQGGRQGSRHAGSRQAVERRVGLETSQQNQQKVNSKTIRDLINRRGGGRSKHLPNADGKFEGRMQPAA